MGLVTSATAALSSLESPLMLGAPDLPSRCEDAAIEINAKGALA